MIPELDVSRGPAAIADGVRRACEEVGFLTVVGHGVPDDLIGEVASVSRAFFDRPDHEKEPYRGPAETPGVPVYRPLGAEKLGANADRKASLDWGPSLPGVGWPPGVREPFGSSRTRLPSHDLESSACQSAPPLYRPGARPWERCLPCATIGIDWDSGSVSGAASARR